MGGRVTQSPPRPPAPPCPSLQQFPLPQRTDRTRGVGAGSPAPPTDDDEDFPLDVGLDVDAAAALRVVCAAQAGDVHHAAFVHVHHAGCEGREGHGSGWAPPARCPSKGSSHPFPPLPIPTHPQARTDRGGGTLSVLSEASGFSLSPPPAYPNGSEGSIAPFNGGGGGRGCSFLSNRQPAGQPGQSLGEGAVDLDPQTRRKQPGHQRPPLSKCTYCHISSPGG